MTEAIIGLSITYVGLAALLLVMVLFTRWPVWTKLACVVLVTAFYFVTYRSLTGMLGWPTRAELPERFLLLASSISEPDKTRGSDGSVHIWATSLDSGRPAAEPRAYALPYSRELHAQLEEANKDMRNGIMQLGRRVTTEADADVPRDTTRFARRRERLEIYDLPDPELPEK